MIVFRNLCAYLITEIQADGHGEISESGWTFVYNYGSTPRAGEE